MFVKVWGERSFRLVEKMIVWNITYWDNFDAGLILYCGGGCQVIPATATCCLLHTNCLDCIALWCSQKVDKQTMHRNACTFSAKDVNYI